MWTSLKKFNISNKYPYRDITFILDHTDMLVSSKINYYTREIKWLQYNNREQTL